MKFKSLFIIGSFCSSILTSCDFLSTIPTVLSANSQSSAKSSKTINASLRIVPTYELDPYIAYTDGGISDYSLGYTSTAGVTKQDK